MESILLDHLFGKDKHKLGHREPFWLAPRVQFERKKFEIKGSVNGVIQQWTSSIGQRNWTKSFSQVSQIFLWYLVLDVTANCICEMHCLALDGFDLNAVHKLSSKEKKILAEPGFKPGAAGCFLWATQPTRPTRFQWPTLTISKFELSSLELNSQRQFGHCELLPKLEYLDSIPESPVVGSTPGAGDVFSMKAP